MQLMVTHAGEYGKVQPTTHEHCVDTRRILETLGRVQTVPRTASCHYNPTQFSPPRHAPSSILAPATPSAL